MGERRPGPPINSGRVKISSSLALLFLTVDADARPGDGLEADGLDFLFAIHTDTVCTEVHPVDGLFDGAEKLCLRFSTFFARRGARYRLVTSIAATVG